MKHSILASQIAKSPLKAQAVLRPKSTKVKSGVNGTLLLTSLVDAFSILVIYLLMNTSAANETLDLDSKMQLPLAAKSHILESGTVIKIEDEKYIIEGQEVALENLVEHLNQIRELKASESDDSKLGLIIQADKAISYKDINPILLAGSQSGFHQLRFAVLQKEEI